MQNPREIAYKTTELTKEYTKKLNELGEIKSRKAEATLRFKAECKTVGEAKLMYEASEDGVKEIKLEFYTKGLIEEIRANKLQLKIIQAEAWGVH